MQDKATWYATEQCSWGDRHFERCFVPTTGIARNIISVGTISVIALGA